MVALMDVLSAELSAGLMVADLVVVTAS